MRGRYPLFFQQLMKAVPKDDENYAKLEKATEMVCEVSRCVDESLEKGVLLQALLEPLGAEYMQVRRAQLPLSAARTATLAGVRPGWPPIRGRPLDPTRPWPVNARLCTPPAAADCAAPAAGARVRVRLPYRSGTL